MTYEEQNKIRQLRITYALKLAKLLLADDGIYLNSAYNYSFNYDEFIKEIQQKEEYKEARETLKEMLEIVSKETAGAYISGSIEEYHNILIDDKELNIYLEKQEKIKKFNQQNYWRR